MLFNLESGIHPADHNVYKVISDSRCGIKFESVLMRLTNLEPIIQNKVSQKEKDIYCILTYTESRKMVLENLFTGQQWRNRQRIDLWTWGEGRRG